VSVTHPHRGAHTRRERRADSCPLAPVTTPPVAATTVYLVRHGETVWNTDGRCQGRADSPLTELGRAQITELALALSNVAFDAAYTSPQDRARATAAAVLHGTGLRAAPLSDLSELDYGELQGTRFVDWPDGLYDSWRHDPSTVSFRGGESRDDAQRRAMSVLGRIVDAHRGETVLVSSHGHVIRLVIMQLEKVPPSDFWLVEQPNASFVALRFGEDWPGSGDTE